MAELIVEPIEKYGLSSTHRSKTLFSKIGVIGCGREGQMIVQIASMHGMEVVFVELSDDKIQIAIDKISKGLDTVIENWGLTQGEKRAIMSRIKGTMNLADLKGCDFVIEAIRADETTGERSINVRKDIFKKLEEVVSPETIIATNASHVVISELAAELEHRERCVSLHFFVTSAEARIIEVVRGLYTSEEVYNKVCTFVKLINRDVIPVAESTGLISVRLYVVLLNEACATLMEGVAKMEDIDKVMAVGFGMRFGPFREADNIGLSKIVKWMENLYEEFGDVKYKVSPVIRRLVRAKRFGVESGAGFYRYNSEGKVIGCDDLISKF